MDARKVIITKADERLTRWSLTFGILIWFADLNTIYALPSLACQWNWFPFKILGIPGLLLVQGGITLISAALLLFMIFLAWRNWRKFQTKNPAQNPNILEDTEKDRRSLMAFVAMLANSFFFLFAIAFFVPMLTLNPCVYG